MNLPDRVHLPDAAPVDEIIAELLQAGDRAGAIEAYRRFAEVHPHAAQTNSRLRGVYERALWSVPRELPTNLPVPRSALVGRHHESEAIFAALMVHSAAVVVGAAGVGKTRLALEAGRRMMDEFEDGVWWCDLTNAAASEQVAAFVADALKLEPSAAGIGALCAALQPREALIILDRCESVTEAVEQFLVHVRAECPRVRVLMTSRTAIAGAHMIPMQNLPLPPAGKVERADALASEAVRLFLERAIAADRSFAITDENAPAVVQICRSVAGSPFGIEIAAAYLAHASLEELGKRIAERALHDIAEAAYASVDWAYQLLAPADKRLLRSLSIFPLHWTIDDAGAVSGLNASAGVKRLAAMSLVIAEPLKTGLTQYSLLDATRHYARERLAEHDELQDARVRFIERMKSVVCDLHNVKRRPPQPPMPAMQMAVNLCHALQLGIACTRCLEPALQLCGLLGAEAGRVMVLSSGFDSVKGLIASAQRAGLAQTPQYADALSTFAWLANFAGNHALANESHLQVITSARTGGDASRMARALSRALPPLLNARKYEQAEAFASEALEHGRAVDDVESCADALRGLSAVEYFNGRYEGAIRHYDEFMNLPHDRIPPKKTALMLSGFSAIMGRRGDYARAQAAAERALGIAYESEDYGTAAHCEKNLAFFLLAQGHLVKGHEALGRAVSLAQLSANRLTQLDALEELAAASVCENQLEAVAYVLGYVDAQRKRVRFEMPQRQEERAQQIRGVVRRLYGAEHFDIASARGELANQGDVFATVSRLRPGDGTLEEVDRFGALSPREREVAQLASQGLTNREIAQTLTVSVRTVDAHVATILRKLGIERREQIAK